MGKAAVQEILKKHGIDRVLAREGGRTSRGSIRNMIDYVEFMNRLEKDGIFDGAEVEKYWIERVNDFFAGKPFKIRVDTSKSVRAMISDILSQAAKRQKEGSGTQYVGGMIQHLVGAKLDCVLGIGQVEHNSFSTSDQQTGRPGDFFVGDVAIHVTTAPGESVIARCKANLEDGHKPLLVTLGSKKLAVASGLAENANLQDRIDVFEVEQFLTSNLYEIGRFSVEGRRSAVTELVDRYNELIDDYESDVSMKIKLTSR